MNAPRPMLPLTRAHTSDSRTFGPQFVELALWPVSLLNRPIDTATEFAARGPDWSSARSKRSTRRKRSLAAPACRSHALHAKPLHCCAAPHRGDRSAPWHDSETREAFARCANGVQCGGDDASTSTDIHALLRWVWVDDGPFRKQAPYSDSLSVPGEVEQDL